MHPREHRALSAADSEALDVLHEHPAASLELLMAALGDTAPATVCALELQGLARNTPMGWSLTQLGHRARREPRRSA